MPDDEEKGAPKLKQNRNDGLARCGENQLGASSVAKWLDKDFGVAQGWVCSSAQMFTSHVNLDDPMIISYLWA